MSTVPAVIATIPTAPQKFTGSPSRIRASRIAKTVESLSMGATRETFPRASAAK